MSSKLSKDDKQKMMAEIAKHVSDGLYTVSKKKGKQANKFTSPVYEVWQFVYNEKDEWVAHWYRCSVCNVYKYCKTGSGVGPLSRHECYVALKKLLPKVNEEDASSSDTSNGAPAGSPSGSPPGIPIGPADKRKMDSSPVEEPVKKVVKVETGTLCKMLATMTLFGAEKRPLSTSEMATLLPQEMEIDPFNTMEWESFLDRANTLVAEPNVELPGPCNAKLTKEATKK